MSKYFCPKCNGRCAIVFTKNKRDYYFKCQGTCGDSISREAIIETDEFHNVMKQKSGQASTCEIRVKPTEVD